MNGARGSGPGPGAIRFPPGARDAAPAGVLQAAAQKGAGRNASQVAS